MLKLVHITPHLGGGVGNFITRLIQVDSENYHEVILLELPNKKVHVNELQKEGVSVYVCKDYFEIKNILERTDIVIVHWWHHPKSMEFLFNLSQIPVRVIIWSHISNLTVPSLNSKIMELSTGIVFTTPASRDSTEYRKCRQIVSAKTEVIYACSNFKSFSHIKPQKHKGFNIGYLGSVDFSKLHPEFVGFCSAVGIDEARFVMVGDNPAKNSIMKQAKLCNMEDVFLFKGYTENVQEELSTFDVFGYPLMPDHTCTTENAVLEAMAAGVPPVLIKQLTEKWIVKDGKTGILVSGEVEYGAAMRYLYENPDKRREIGRNARRHILLKYTDRKLKTRFDRLLHKCMEEGKQLFDYRKCLGYTPSMWFLSCMGKDSQAFYDSVTLKSLNRDAEAKRCLESVSSILKLPNKASVFQYAREFPEDKLLSYWSSLL